MTARPTVIGVGDAPPPRGKYVVAVPGQLAPLQQFDLPDRVTGAARLAVARQQLADRLGASANAVTLIPVGGNLWDRAVVCDAEMLGSWCATEAVRQPRCTALVPDMLTLPAGESTLVLDVRGDTLLARGSDIDGFSAPLALAGPLLERLITDGGPDKLFVRGDLPPDIQVVLSRFDLQPAAEPAEATRPIVDMRKAMISKGNGAIWLTIAAAAVALLAFGIYAASIWAETRSLRADERQVRDATVALLREDLIPSGPILDIRQQVTQAIATQGGDGGPESFSPVNLLSRATVALFGTGLDVGNITLASESNALDIEIAAQSFGEIDELVSTLNDGDLRAVANDMRNSSDGGVSARLRLRPVGVAE